MGNAILPRVLAEVAPRDTFIAMTGVAGSPSSAKSTIPKAVRATHVTPASTIAFRRMTLDRPISRFQNAIWRSGCFRDTKLFGTEKGIRMRAMGTASVILFGGSIEK